MGGDQERKRGLRDARAVTIMIVIKACAFLRERPGADPQKRIPTLRLMARPMVAAY